MSYQRYPDVIVPLVGEDGNAFAILGRVDKALQRAGVDKAERREFYDEATEGDYDHLLSTVMRWVLVDRSDEDENSDLVWDEDYQDYV
jgi:hypothetical protein